MGAQHVPRRPVVSDGYALCERIYGEGHCTCRAQGKGPCSSLFPPLAVTGADVDLCHALEHDRIKGNRATGNMFLFHPSLPINT